MQNYTVPTILSIVILTLLLIGGLWLFVYGSNLEQKTVILPTVTISPVLSPTPSASSAPANVESI